MHKIGAEFYITRERVRQLLKKYFGITGCDGGQFLKTTSNKIADAIEKSQKKERRDSIRYSRAFKCTKEQFLAIHGEEFIDKKHRYGKRPASAYYNQKCNARTRGIDWNISFPDWWKIWRESGHWEQRGRGKGYCMTRIGDTGGYEVGNVEIKTNAQNFSDSYFKHPASERIKKRKPYSQGTKTHCNRGHERSPENTSSINTKNGVKNTCRLCCNERARERRKLIQAVMDVK